MKKIAFALVALLVALSPVAAGESWIGVTTGPAFEIQVTDDLADVGATDTTVTDFNWDINLEGAYYFDEAETIGIGAKLGVGIYYGSTFEIKDEMLQKLAMEAIGSDALAAILQQAQMTPDAFMASVLDSVEYKSITGGTKIAPAITFQYRLALADNLDLRLGAGLQYIHTFGQGMNETVDLRALKSALAQSGLASAHAGESIPDSLSIKSSVSLDAIEIIANADVVYSLGDIQIFGGVDLGFTVMTYMKQTTEIAELGMKTSEGEFITDGFGFSITPRVGVSYAF